MAGGVGQPWAGRGSPTWKDAFLAGEGFDSDEDSNKDPNSDDGKDNDNLIF